MDSSGSPPGSPSTSAISASTTSESTVKPARRAGNSIARRSSSRRIGPTSTWLAPSRRDSSGIDGAAAVEVGADGHQHERAPAYDRGPRDELVDERRPLGLVAADGEDLLELVDRDDQPASPARPRRSRARAPARGCSPGRSSASAQSSLPGSTPPASAASSPARSAEDLPLPDGPHDPHQRRARQARHHLGHQAARVRRTARRPRRQTTPAP